MEQHELANPLERLRKMTEGKRVAMLTTVDDDGSLRCRPMWAQRIDDDATLWFLTSTGSHKVREVEHDEHVNISFSDSESDRYISVSGVAHIAHDEERTRKLWELVDPHWFPPDTENPDLALLKVTIQSVEYWDPKACAMHRLAGLGAAPAPV